MKGISERELFKVLVMGLKFVKQDSFKITNEFKSTVTCSSCFHRTLPQMHRRDGLIHRIKGAIVYYNNLYPRRLEHKVTTRNRDQNGAANISLIEYRLCYLKMESRYPLFIRNSLKKTLVSY